MMIKTLAVVYLISVIIALVSASATLIYMLKKELKEDNRDETHD